MIIESQGMLNESENIYLPLIGAGNARILNGTDKTWLLIKLIECYRDYNKTNYKNFNIIIWKGEWKDIDIKRIKNLF